MASASDMGPLEVQTRPDRDRVILEVRGELDMASVGSLQAALDELRGNGWERIVLDVRELTFIDSSGLALLLDTDRAARRSGVAFEVVDGSPAFARLLEVVGLQDHFARAHVP